jgi:O-antigen/teichoic acid export membrane protein
LSIVRLGEVIMSAASTLILIYFEFGYISLAIGTVIGNISSTMLFFIFRPKVVSYLPYFRDLKIVMKSGFFTSFAALIRRGATVSPELIIGKMAGINDAALFSRGAGFVQFSRGVILGIISPVVAPYLAKSNREGEILADSYINVNLLVGGICWPILAVAGVFAEQAITLLFGQQWVASAPIASILVISALISMIFVNFEQLLLTIGKEKYTFYYQIVLTIFTIASCIGAALIDSSYVPFALITSSVLQVLMQAILFKKFFDINIITYIWKLKRSISITATCFIAAWFIEYLVTKFELNAFFAIVILVIIMPPFWLISVIIFKHPIFSEVNKLIFALKKHIFN